MSNVQLPDMTLVEALQTRRSVRGFTDKTIPDDILKAVFTQAQLAPSNCNTQPWKTYVASGALRDSISEKLIAKVMGGEKPNYDFDYNNTFEGEYRTRQVECAAAMYGEMGITRGLRE